MSKNVRSFRDLRNLQISQMCLLLSIKKDGLSLLDVNLLFIDQDLFVDGRRGHPLHGLLDDLGVEIAQVGRVDAIDGGAT